MSLAGSECVPTMFADRSCNANQLLKRANVGLAYVSLNELSVDAGKEIKGSVRLAATASTTRFSTADTLPVKTAVGNFARVLR